MPRTMFEKGVPRGIWPGCFTFKVLVVLAVSYHAALQRR
jgi:hypothetical protein